MAAKAKTDESKVVNINGRLHDELTELGFTVTKVSSGWIARKPMEGGGFEARGPSPTVQELYEAVKGQAPGADDGWSDDDDDAGESEEEEAVTHTSKGQAYLPAEGMAPKSIPSLKKKILEYHATKNERIEALNREKVLKAELIDECHKHLEHFSPPDEAGTRYYSAGDVTVEIRTINEEKIKTIVTDED